MPWKEMAILAAFLLLGYYVGMKYPTLLASVGLTP